jgi:hypothetical protein
MSKKQATVSEKSMQYSPADYMSGELEKMFWFRGAPAITSYTAFETLHLRRDMMALEELVRSQTPAPRYIPRPGRDDLEERRLMRRAAMLAQEKRLHQPSPGYPTHPSPPFFQEPDFVIDGQMHDGSMFVKFDKIPPVDLLPYVGFTAFYRVRNQLTAETTDTKVLRVFLDWEEDRTVTGWEHDREVLTDEDMLYPLGVVLAARVAVANRRQELEK